MYAHKLNNLDGIDKFIVTRVLIRGRQEGQRKNKRQCDDGSRGTLEDATLLELKAEGEGCRQPLEDKRREGNRFPLKPSK